MDNNHSHNDDVFDLTVQGTSIQPGTVYSRLSSAKSESESKQSTVVSSRPSSSRSDVQSKGPGINNSRPSSARVNGQSSKEPEPILSRPPSASIDVQFKDPEYSIRLPSTRLDYQPKESSTSSSRSLSARSDSQAKQPGIVNSRPTSARNNSQSKEPSVISSRPSSARSDRQSNGSQTPTREGNVKERRPSLTSSTNFSSARKRRLSNTSQRSNLVTSPPVDSKKPTAASTSSSIFRALSPRQHDADAFFTDESQKKSIEHNPDDERWDDTSRWINEIHESNTSFILPQQTHGVVTMGMSRDSLNGTMTMTGANVFQTNDHRHNQFVPIAESVHSEQLLPTEAEKTSITIEQKQNDQEKLNSFEQTYPNEIEHTPNETQQENNKDGLGSRRQSSSSSTSTNIKLYAPSPVPSISNMDQKIRSASSVTSSGSTTPRAPSKVNISDIYDSLRKLEEVDQFPTQRSMEQHDSAYITDPTSVLQPSFVDELPPDSSYHVDPVLDNLNETNQSDRSQKSSTHNRSSPALTRFTRPPQSDRQSQPRKLAQSAALSYYPSTSFNDQRNRYGTNTTTAAYRSLMTNPYETNDREDEFKNSNRIKYDGREKRTLFRVDYEEKQRRQQTTMIEQEINEPKQSSFHLSNSSEQDFEFHFQRQKDEYESIIQRHLKFIDQLIDDKKKLSQRCELLLSELKTIDKKYNNRIRSIEESQRNELQKLKDVHDAAEKLRRERWIEEKTKKIKELTVRGLEPEIQKLISKHKNEMSKLKTIHEAELLAADERASQRYIRMVGELRDQLEREKEVAIARERDLAREKYEKSLHDEQQNLNNQRTRLYTEVEEEKARQADSIAKQHADLDKLRRDIEENHRSVVESNKLEYEAVRLERERQYANQIQELKDQYESEKRNWEENLLKQQETLLAGKQRELREQMKQERDKEIEKIIAQFESDTTTTKEEAERTAETRLKRIREKYEADIRELENTEKETRNRFNQVNGQLIEIQDESQRLRSLLTQKEAEKNDIKTIAEALQQERDHLSDIIRQEFADRLVLTEDENRRVKGEMAELRARQQLELNKKKQEIDELVQKQDRELETLHEKIQQANTKKEEQVRGLHVQYENALKRVQHLEGLLSQQRKLISTIPSSGTNVFKKPQPS